MSLSAKEQRICDAAEDGLRKILAGIPADLPPDQLRSVLLNVLLNEFVSSPPTPNEMSLTAIALGAIIRLKELERL